MTAADDDDDGGDDDGDDDDDDDDDGQEVKEARAKHSSAFRKAIRLHHLYSDLPM